MNTQLKKLFEDHKLRDKDKFEINQIFELLPPDRQNNILYNFDLLVYRLEYNYKEINLEKRILIWDIFRDIKEIYSKYN